MAIEIECLCLCVMGILYVNKQHNELLISVYLINKLTYNICNIQCGLAISRFKSTIWYKPLVMIIYIAEGYQCATTLIVAHEQFYKFLFRIVSFYHRPQNTNRFSNVLYKEQYIYKIIVSCTFNSNSIYFN